MPRFLLALAAAAVIATPAFAATAPHPSAKPAAGKTMAKTPGASAATSAGAAKAVTAAEKAFDAFTHIHGYTKGFFTFSAPDAIVFHPQALRIHDALAAKELTLNNAEPDAPSSLRWAPYRVEAATSGDLAFDLGTWTLGGGDGTTTQAGWFFTVWKKQANGKWLWTLDTTAGSADANNVPAMPLANAPQPMKHAAAATGDAKSAVASLDDALNRVLGATVADSALTGGKYGMLDSQAVVLTSDRPPATSADDIAASLKTRPANATWTPDGGDMSASGDFAESYGHVAAQDGTYLGHYVRVWVKRGADWTLLVDLYGASGT